MNDYNKRKNDDSPIIGFLRSLFVPPEEDNEDDYIVDNNNDIAIDNTNSFEVEDSQDTDDSVVSNNNCLIKKNTSNDLNVEKADSIDKPIKDAYQQTETNSICKSPQNNLASHQDNANDLVVEDSQDIDEEDVSNNNCMIENDTSSVLSTEEADSVDITIKESDLQTENNRTYNSPSISIFKNQDTTNFNADYAFLQTEATKLINLLKAYGISSEVKDIICLPSLYRFDLVIESGTQVKKLMDLHDEIQFSMSVKSVRIIAPNPGVSYVSVEISKAERNDLYLRWFLESDNSKSAHILTVPLGFNLTDSQQMFCNLNNESIIMISGYSHSGKTNLINCIICSVLFNYSPDTVRLLMADFNEYGLSTYNSVAHMVLPVATDFDSLDRVLEYAIDETDRRLKVLMDSGVRNITKYNAKCEEEGGAKMPHILFVIEGFYTAFKYHKENAVKLSQLGIKCKNAGIHIIISAESTSEKSILDEIMPAVSLRMSFVQPSKKESINSIGEKGAEDLLCSGDMLVRLSDRSIKRVQPPLIDYSEVLAIVKHLRETSGSWKSETFVLHDSAQSKIKSDDDDMFNKAVELVINNGSASVSLLQRHLGITYPYAARLIDDLERKRIVGPYTGSKPRRILITMDEWKHRNN